MQDQANIVDCELAGEKLKTSIMDILVYLDEQIKFEYSLIRDSKDAETRMILVSGVMQITKRRDMMRSLIFTFYDLIDEVVKAEEGNQL